MSKVAGPGLDLYNQLYDGPRVPEILANIQYFDEGVAESIVRMESLAVRSVVPEPAETAVEEIQGEAEPALGEVDS